MNRNKCSETTEGFRSYMCNTTKGLVIGGKHWDVRVTDSRLVIGCLVSASTQQWRDTRRRLPDPFAWLVQVHVYNHEPGDLVHATGADSDNRPANLTVNNGGTRACQRITPRCKAKPAASPIAECRGSRGSGRAAQLGPNARHGIRSSPAKKLLYRCCPRKLP